MRLSATSSCNQWARHRIETAPVLIRSGFHDQGTMVRSLFKSFYLSIAIRDDPAFCAMHFLAAPFNVAVRWTGWARSMGPETFRIPRAIASTIAAEGDPAVRWFCEAMPVRGTVLSTLVTREGKHGGTLAEEACGTDTCLPGASAAVAGVMAIRERTITPATLRKNVNGLIVFLTRSLCPQIRTDMLIPTLVHFAGRCFDFLSLNFLASYFRTL